jgi:hypothetical protein
VSRSRRGLLVAVGALLAGCSGGDGGDAPAVSPATVPSGGGDATLADIRAVEVPAVDPPLRVPAAHVEASLDRLGVLVEAAERLLERADIRYVLEDRQRIEGARRLLERSDRTDRTLAYLQAVRGEIREMAGVLWHLRAIAGKVGPADLPDPREPAAAARRYADGLAYRGEPGGLLAWGAPAEGLLREAVRVGERVEPPDAEPGGVGWPEAVRRVAESRATARRSLADARALVGAVPGGDGPSRAAELQRAIESLPRAAAAERERLRETAADSGRSGARGTLLDVLASEDRVHERRLAAAREAADAGRLALAAAGLARVLVRQQGARRALSAAELESGGDLRVTPALALSAKRRAARRIGAAARATEDRPFARLLLGAATERAAAGDDRLGGSERLAAAYGRYLLAAGLADATVPVADRLR